MGKAGKFRYSIFLLTAIIAFGTFGYYLFEEMPLFEAFYMTIITISTVGFSEIRPLTIVGRSITLVVIVLGISVGTYTIGIIVRWFVEGELSKIFGRRKLHKQIADLKNHFIIVGGGDVGREAAYEFRRSKRKFVIVDRNPSQSELSRDESIPFLEGDAINDEVLVAAKIEKASGLISALPDDEANVFVVLTARQLNPHLLIVSQAAEERSIRKLIKADVIQPDLFDEQVVEVTHEGKRLVLRCDPATRRKEGRLMGPAV